MIMLLILVIFFSSTLTSDAHTINDKVEKCIDQCNYTTFCTAKCINSSVPDWENEISNNILSLKKIMTKYEYKILIKSQKKWKEYRKAQEILDSETLGKLNGTMFSIVIAGNKIEILENRANELERIYRYFSDK